MLHLIPAVKSLEIRDGFLCKKAISFYNVGVDPRLVTALTKLPTDPEGVPVTLSVDPGEGEDYTLTVSENAIAICGSVRGVFYGIQTLRQLFTHGRIPCLHIQDAPDFAYRGFYHDMTRGRISKAETLVQLVEEMAYYKLNSLQLYVEHVFPFKETVNLTDRLGCITPEELIQVQAACRENFVDFIPSLATFGHLYELLEQPEYKHLAALPDYKAPHNFWDARMLHHTLNPLLPQSQALVESLLEQYAPYFESEFFNICCDETFDLANLGSEDPGKVYLDFVQKIIAMVKNRGKKVMMWADILLQHPEVIDRLPQDTIFLNWNYKLQPLEENVAKLAGQKQILCPGNSAWYRFCEDVEIAEGNISQMAHYAKKYGALGVLNTNWGDWGHPANLEMGMYGLVLGAEKSWTEATLADEDFHRHTDHLLYRQEGATELLTELSRLHKRVRWKDFVRTCLFRQYGEDYDCPVSDEDIAAVQQALPTLQEKLSGTWEKDAYRRELLCVAQGLCLMAELSAKKTGREVTSLVDPEQWKKAYAANWRRTNKESELQKILDIFDWYNT